MYAFTYPRFVIEFSKPEPTLTLIATTSNHGTPAKVFPWTKADSIFMVGHKECLGLIFDPVRESCCLLDIHYVNSLTLILAPSIMVRHAL